MSFFHIYFLCFGKGRKTESGVIHKIIRTTAAMKKFSFFPQTIPEMKLMHLTPLTA